MTGDDPSIPALLDYISLSRLKNQIDQHELVVVDEAQRFTNAGLMLKLITDHFPQIQLFVTGSSSIDLAAQTIGADPITVERYIDFLEQSFVRFRLSSPS